MLFWYGLSGLLAYLAFYVALNAKFCRTQDSNSVSNRKKTLCRCFLWSRSAMDVALDIISNHAMFTYLQSLKSSDCSTINFIYLPALYPRLNISSYKFSNFSRYSDLLLDQMNRDFLDGLITIGEMQDARLESATQFRVFCELIPNCNYAAESYECKQDHKYLPEPLFMNILASRKRTNVMW